MGVEKKGGGIYLGPGRKETGARTERKRHGSSTEYQASPTMKHYCGGQRRWVSKRLRCSKAEGKGEDRQDNGLDKVHPDVHPTGRRRRYDTRIHPAGRREHVAAKRPYQEKGAAVYRAERTMFPTIEETATMDVDSRGEGRRRLRPKRR